MSWPQALGAWHFKLDYLAKTDNVDYPLGSPIVERACPLKFRCSAVYDGRPQALTNERLRLQTADCRGTKHAPHVPQCQKEDTPADLCITLLASAKAAVVVSSYICVSPNKSWRIMGSRGQQGVSFKLLW
jgi:hypothetical protein